MEKLLVTFKACLLAIGIAACSLPASAQLSVTGGTPFNLTTANGTFNPYWLGGIANYSSTFNLNTMLRGAVLSSNAADNLTFSLVGYEAGFNNAFTSNNYRLDNRLGTMSLLGTSFSFSSFASGPIQFSFISNGIGTLFSNGSNSTGVIMSNNGKEALLIFNDLGNDLDFDDMVIRVSVSAVSEPETIIMFLGGLSLLLAASKRKKNKSGKTV